MPAEPSWRTKSVTAARLHAGPESSFSAPLLQFYQHSVSLCYGDIHVFTKQQSGDPGMVTDRTGPTRQIRVTHHTSPDLVETRLPVCVCDLSVSGLNFLRTFDPVTLHRPLLSSSLIIFAYDIQLCVLYLISFLVKWGPSSHKIPALVSCQD